MSKKHNLKLNSDDYHQTANRKKYFSVIFLMAEESKKRNKNIRE